MPRIFDSDSFVDVAITGHQAKDIALTADEILCKNSICLWGKFDGKHYYDISSYRKTKDHIKLLAYAPKEIGPQAHERRTRRF